MTHFSLTPAATIEPETGIEHANDYMKRRGVRALLVTDVEGGMVGMLTATDVLGEKPVQFALEREVRRQEIRVVDIMPRSKRPSGIGVLDSGPPKILSLVYSLELV
jgi:CBS domain-containing protein